MTNYLDRILFIKNYGLYLLIILFHLINLPSSLNKPFYSKGEPREALSSQYMLETGHWIIAKRYGDEIQTKPPFSHWITAVSSLLAKEVTEFTARIPSLIFSLAVLIYFFVFLSKELNTKIAFYTCLILILAPEWLRASQTSRVDMTLAGCQTLASLILYQYYQSNFLKKKYLVISVFFLSCAFLTKGPVGLVLPLAAFASFLIIKRIPFRKIIAEGLIITALSSLLPGLWYFLAYQELGYEFLQVVLLENVQRLSSTMSTGDEPHEHTIFYLYLTVLAGIMPFSIYLITGLWEQKSYYSIKSICLKIWKNDLLLYFTLITVTELTFFSIPSSKRSVYLLPIYPYLAFFLGSFFLNFHEFKSWKILNRIFLAMISFFAVVTAIFLMLDFNQLASTLNLSPRKLIEFNFYQKNFGADFGINFHGIGLLLFILTPLFFKIIIKKHPTAELRFLTITYALALILISGVILPRLSKSLTANNLAPKFQAIINQRPLAAYTYNFRDYALNFYMDGQLKELAKTSKKPIAEKEFYLICKDIECKEAQQKLAKNYNYQHLMSGYFSFDWPSKLYHLYQVRTGS